MTAQGSTLFDTAIGPCAIAWGMRGVAGVALPEQDATTTRMRLVGRLPHARETVPPPDVEQAIRAIVALLRGEPIDLSWIALDLDQIPAFDRQVYEITRTIPAGTTRTYGQIAAQLLPRSRGREEWELAREVGQSLGRNPFPIIVPCHRVLAAGGKPGGFSARGGIATKLRLLAIEGARASDQPTLFDSGPLGFALRPRPSRARRR